jgi:hypothetical protein
MITLGTGQTAPLALFTTARLRVCSLLVTVVCTLVAGASAQTPAPEPGRAPALVHYGKWAALGLAAGLTILGARTHDRADRDYTTLLRYCSGSAPCPIAADGRYADPAAEALYRRVRAGDRAAGAWLVGGEVALAGGAVLFVMELMRTKGPENIPYSPYIVAGRFGTRVGFQLAWRWGMRASVMGDR